MSKTKTKILETTRGKNEFMIDPRNIEVVEGFNGREFFDRAELEKLKGSIKENGVVTPIEVKKIRGTDRYQLIDGERRWRVCMELINEGVDIRIPSNVFAGNDVDALVHMLIKNDNVRLSFVEEASVIKRFYALGLTDKEISKLTGRPKAYLLSLQRISTVPESIKKLILKGHISHTLVLEVVKDENVDLTKAFKEIEATVIANKELGKVKTTKKHIDKVIGKIDSFSALKKIVKTMGDREISSSNSVKIIADFSKEIIENKFSFEQLEKYFFKQN